SFRALVRLARIFFGLLVHLQTQARTVLRLCGTDSTFTKRDVPAFSAPLRCLRVRESHHNSEQSTVSVFSGEIYSPAWLDSLGPLWIDLRFQPQGTLAPVCALLEPAAVEHLRSGIRKIAQLLPVLAAFLRSAELVVVWR